MNIAGTQQQGLRRLVPDRGPWAGLAAPFSLNTHKAPLRVDLSSPAARHRQDLGTTIDSLKEIYAGHFNIGVSSV